MGKIKEQTYKNHIIEIRCYQKIKREDRLTELI